MTIERSDSRRLIWAWPIVRFGRIALVDRGPLQEQFGVLGHARLVDYQEPRCEVDLGVIVGIPLGFLDHCAGSNELR